MTFRQLLMIFAEFPPSCPWRQRDEYLMAHQLESSHIKDVAWSRLVLMPYSFPMTAVTNAVDWSNTNLLFYILKVKDPKWALQNEIQGISQPLPAFRGSRNSSAHDHVHSLLALLSASQNLLPLTFLSPSLVMTVGFHLDKPRESFYLKILHLITSAESFLPYKVTFIDARD